MQLRDAVIIVTGASAGIGAACVHHLASHGAHVVAVARREEALATVVASLPGQHSWVAGDITLPETMPAVVRHALDTYGRIDGIVCNAGIGLSSPVAELRWDDVVQCMNVNVGGVISAVQAVLPQFLAQHHGSIVVVSSVVGVQGLPFSGGYCASKGALERICDALRIELLSSPIRLSVVRPGTVATEFFAHRMGSNGEVRRQRNRGISPHVVATVVARTLTRHSRISYTRWQDRMLLWASAMAPSIADKLLHRMIQWRTQHTPPAH